MLTSQDYRNSAWEKIDGLHPDTKDQFIAIAKVEATLAIYEALYELLGD